MNETGASGVVVGEGAGGWVAAEVRVRGTESDVEHSHRLRRAFRLRTDDGTEYEVECGGAEVEGGSTLEVRGTWGELREGPQGALLGEFSAAPSFPLQLEAEGVRAGDYVWVEGASELRASASRASAQPAGGSEKGYRQAAGRERVIVAERVVAVERSSVRSSSWRSSPGARHGLTAVLVALAIAPWFVWGVPVHPVGTVVRAALSYWFAVLVCIRLVMERGHPHAFPDPLALLPFPQPASFEAEPRESTAKQPRDHNSVGDWLVKLTFGGMVAGTALWRWARPDGWESTWRTVPPIAGRRVLTVLALIACSWALWGEHRLYQRRLRAFWRRTAPLVRPMTGWRVTQGEVATTLTRRVAQVAADGPDWPLDQVVAAFTPPRAHAVEPSTIEQRYEGANPLVVRGEAAEVAVDLSDATFISWLPATTESKSAVGPEGSKRWTEITSSVPAGSRALVAAYGEQGEAEWKSIGPDALVVAFGPPGQDVGRLVRRSRRMAWSPYLVTGFYVVLTAGVALWTLR